MSIVKESSAIRKALHERLKEVYPSDKGFMFKNSEVVRDAEERGFKIAPESLSRYMGNKTKSSSLSETQLIWLCTRYGIKIGLIVEPVKFNEVDCLKRLKMIFGK